MWQHLFLVLWSSTEIQSDHLIVKSWEGLLWVVVTDISTTLMEVIIRVKWTVVVQLFTLFINYSLDSDDDFRSGCRNLSHHYWKQSFSGLHSPRQSNYTITCYPQVQIFMAQWMDKCKLNACYMAGKLFNQIQLIKCSSYSHCMHYWPGFMNCSIEEWTFLYPTSTKLF